MLQVPWLTLDALQAGALLALAAAFGADALHRRDRIIGWLAFACMLVALRHAAGILDHARVLPADPADRLQSLVGASGYLAMARAIALIFPAFFPRRFLGWMVLGVLPNLVRCLFLPLETPLARGLHWITMLTYLWGCGLTLLAMSRAHRARDPLGGRLLGGLAATVVPLALEVIARGVFDLSVRISGVSIMLMAISVGVSWPWVQTHGLQERLERAEAEAEAWRALVPGASWRVQEGSALMDSLFGPDWTARIADRMVGTDGRTYRVHHASPASGGPLGWLEIRREGHASEEFLWGWTVALGVDPGPEAEALEAWLSAWGAQVLPWGTVPPREGPFPSLLIWGREPSILSVWREGDLARRRPRWVQIGGHALEGPHAHLDRPVTEEGLRLALEHLLALQR